MGLDQNAYKVSQDGEREELAYWRKHNRLQGWMEELYRRKGGREEFNMVDVELTLEDIDQLEAAVLNKNLPETGGFFFGDDSFSWDDENGKPFEDGDYHYKETDLKFIEDARKAIAEGKEVYYDSWW